jgi:thiamine phosphate synthase YjbQ (UPF0047 family)
MAFSLKDLLPGAVQRANISREVTAAQIVLEANRFLDRSLSPARRKDVQAISYRDGILVLACLHASAAQAISQQEQLLMREIVSILPRADLRKMITRIMKSFPASEL